MATATSNLPAQHYAITENRQEKLPLRCVKGSRGLAIAQMVMGGILLLLDIIGLSMKLHRMDFTTLAGANFWSGMLFIGTGVVGLLATRRQTVLNKTTGFFAAYLAMSVVSSVTAAGVFSAGVPAAIISTFRYCLDYDDKTYRCKVYADTDAALGVRITSCIIYIAALILFIISSAFGCMNTCRTGSAIVQVIHVQSPISQQSQTTTIPVASSYPLPQFPVKF